MGSTRYPGKTLAGLHGKTLLEQVIARIAASSCVDEIVVATTLEPEDGPIVRLSADTGVATFRGSTDDVLDRYVQAARQHGADVVIRNTADEPFLDPSLIDEAWRCFNDGNADYVSNNLNHIYPEGLDTEVVSMEALEEAWRGATRPSDREHVTPFIWRQPERFRLKAAGSNPMRPDLRLTVDYPGDLVFANAVYEALDGDVGLANVITLLESRPDLLALCPTVPRREGYQTSLQKEEP